MSEKPPSLVLRMLIEFLTGVYKEKSDPIYGSYIREASKHSREFATVMEDNDEANHTEQAAAPVQMHVTNNQMEVNNVSSAYGNTVSGRACWRCNMTSHALPDCPQFKALSEEEKFQFIQSRRLCYNCLLGPHPWL